MTVKCVLDAFISFRICKIAEIENASKFGVRNLGVYPFGPPSRPDGTHSEIVSEPLKISKADRHTHRLQEKGISRSADHFSGSADSAGSDSAADSADPAGSDSCSACSFGSPRFVCNAILHRKREKYTHRTCRIVKNLLKLFCMLYS